MTASNPIRVLLADDHTIVRQGLRALLESDAGVVVIGEAEDGAEAVRKAAELRPDVLVMDIAMREVNGLEAARQILGDEESYTRILILSAYSDDAYVRRAREIGASGFLVKQTAFHVLPEAIRSLHAGRDHFCPSVSIKPDQKESDDRALSLTPREKQVWQQIAEGEANKMIADNLGISIKTVEKHRQKVMDKLGIHDIAGLTRHAIACGIIDAVVKTRIV